MGCRGGPSRRWPPTRPAAGSLVVISGLGQRAMQTLKRRAGFGERLRRATGAAVLLAAGAIALGFDTQALAQLPSPPTSGLETRLVGLLGKHGADDQGKATRQTAAAARPPRRSACATRASCRCSTARAAGSIRRRSPRDALRGKVVVVNFWTYSCINCLRTLPYLKTWAERYGKDGLVVIGVHTPEFGFERDPGNVRRALKDLGIHYPVATDNDYRICRRSTTSTGRPSISPTRTAGSASTTSARAATTTPSARSGSCWPTPATACGGRRRRAGGDRRPGTGRPRRHRLGGNLRGLPPGAGFRLARAGAARPRRGLQHAGAARAQYLRPGQAVERGRRIGRWRPRQARA